MGSPSYIARLRVPTGRVKNTYRVPKEDPLRVCDCDHVCASCTALATYKHRLSVSVYVVYHAEERDGRGKRTNRAARVID